MNNLGGWLRQWQEEQMRINAPRPCNYSAWLMEWWLLSGHVANSAWFEGRLNTLLRQQKDAKP